MRVGLGLGTGNGIFHIFLFFFFLPSLKVTNTFVLASLSYALIYFDIYGTLDIYG